MDDAHDSLAARLGQRLAGARISKAPPGGQCTAEIAVSDLIESCLKLRDDPQFAFNQLSDLCGVDYSAYGQGDWQTEGASAAGFSRGVAPRSEQEIRLDRPRFAVAYHLLSLEHNWRLRLRAYPQGDPPTIPSVVDIWPSANWFEREAFDLFGILFEGHPDLRRLLTDYGFIGHPFRKDFPLEGHVEVRYDPDKGRVVYQPVTIDNRVLVPRVIRNEAGWRRAGPEGETAGA
jgi:NADH-quinone oxidoreductase subunit C